VRAAVPGLAAGAVALVGRDEPAEGLGEVPGRLGDRFGVAVLDLERRRVDDGAVAGVDLGGRGLGRGVLVEVGGLGRAKSSAAAPSAAAELRSRMWSLAIRGRGLSAGSEPGVSNGVPSASRIDYGCLSIGEGPPPAPL
jgi:hypothetical protein